MSTYVCWNLETGEEKTIEADGLCAALTVAADEPSAAVEKREALWTLDEWAVHVSEEDQVLCFDTPR